MECASNDFHYQYKRIQNTITKIKHVMRLHKTYTYMTMKVKMDIRIEKRKLLFNCCMNVLNDFSANIRTYIRTNKHFYSLLFIFYFLFWLGTGCCTKDPGSRFHKYRCNSDNSCTCVHARMPTKWHITKIRRFR